MTSWTDTNKIIDLLWQYYWVGFIGIMLVGMLWNHIKDTFK